jgi:hypothetical protein
MSITDPTWEQELTAAFQHVLVDDNVLLQDLTCLHLPVANVEPARVGP